MVDLWPGMEIGGEVVVAGCCGEERLLLWCSLEAGVDGLPSLLLFVGLSLIYICSSFRWQDWWRRIRGA